MITSTAVTNYDISNKKINKYKVGGHTCHIYDCSVRTDQDYNILC